MNTIPFRPTKDAAMVNHAAEVLERIGPVSDTPETDDALQGVWYRGDHGSAIPALCRRLERERDEARQMVEKLQAKLDLNSFNYCQCEAKGETRG